MKRTKITTVIVTGLLFLIACTKDRPSENGYLLFSASGNIEAELRVFREILGEQLNVTPDVTGGRREINWEAIPDELLNTKIPEDFFNPVGPGEPPGRQRGLVYSSEGEFRVSSTSFSEINPKAAPEFAAFSGTKSFSNISSSLWEVDFQVPGKDMAAKVKGFGIVFSDVDLPGKTFMEFFEGQHSLGKFYVEPHDANSNHSFLGVYFPDARITKVRVGHEGKLIDGNDDISNGGPADLIILDDFIYSEPVPF